MRFFKLPFFLKLIFKDALWRIEPQETSSKTIYLSFDDGPIPEVTPWVVQELDKYQAKATFFCVGENVQKYPDIEKLLLEKGHRLGNHTYHHIKGLKTPLKEYDKDVQKCAEMVKSNLFRPPYGSLTYPQYKQLKKQFKVVLWDVISYDFDTSFKPEDCLKILKKNTRSGSIIVFHDSLKAQKILFKVLPPYLAYCYEQGYSFETIP